MRGLIAPINGAKTVLKSKKMLGISISSFFINLILFVGIFYYGYSFLRSIIIDLVPAGSEAKWLDFSYRGVKVLLQAVIGLFTIYVLSFVYISVAAIVAGPFNDKLSLLTEKHVMGKDFSDDSFASISILKSIKRAISQEIKKVFLMIVIFLISLLINIIPIIGGVVFVGFNYLIFLFFLGFEFFDYPMERRGFSFRQKLKYCISHFVQSIGMGFTTSILLIFPMIFSFSAVGATKLFLKNLESK